jgi:hypothetical protein
MTELVPRHTKAGLIFGAARLTAGRFSLAYDDPRGRDYARESHGQHSQECYWQPIHVTPVVSRKRKCWWFSFRTEASRLRATLFKVVHVAEDLAQVTSPFRFANVDETATHRTWDPIAACQPREGFFKLALASHARADETVLDIEEVAHEVDVSIELSRVGSA